MNFIVDTISFFGLDLANLKSHIRTAVPVEDKAHLGR